MMLKCVIFRGELDLVKRIEELWVLPAHVCVVHIHGMHCEGGRSPIWCCKCTQPQCAVTSVSCAMAVRYIGLSGNHTNTSPHPSSYYYTTHTTRHLTLSHLTPPHLTLSHLTPPLLTLSHHPAPQSHLPLPPFTPKVKGIFGPFHLVVCLA